MDLRTLLNNENANRDGNATSKPARIPLAPLSANRQSFHNKSLKVINRPYNHGSVHSRPHMGSMPAPFSVKQEPSTHHLPPSFPPQLHRPNQLIPTNDVPSTPQKTPTILPPLSSITHNIDSPATPNVLATPSPAFPTPGLGIDTPHNNQYVYNVLNRRMNKDAFMNVNINDDFQRPMVPNRQTSFDSNGSFEEADQSTMPAPGSSHSAPYHLPHVIVHNYHKDLAVKDLKENELDEQLKIHFGGRKRGKGKKQKEAEETSPGTRKRRKLLWSNEASIAAAREFKLLFERKSSSSFLKKEYQIVANRLNAKFGEKRFTETSVRNRKGYFQCLSHIYTSLKDHEKYQGKFMENFVPVLSEEEWNEVMPYFEISYLRKFRGKTDNTDLDIVCTIFKKRAMKKCEDDVKQYEYDFNESE